MTLAVLITRPDPFGAELADLLRSRWGCGVQMVLSPVMRIEWDGMLPDLNGTRVLIFTSQHGVAGFARSSMRRDLPCYAVGPATADTARAAGFTVTEADGDAEALLARIVADSTRGPCLHIRGEHAAGNLAERLNAAGVRTSEVVLYRQVPCPLTDAARACLTGDNPVILPLYSPRSAALLFAAVKVSAPLFVAAISANAAANVPDSKANTVVIADKPDAGGVNRALDALYEKANRLEGAKRAQ